MWQRPAPWLSGNSGPGKLVFIEESCGDDIFPQKNVRREQAPALRLYITLPNKLKFDILGIREPGTVGEASPCIFTIRREKPDRRRSGFVFYFSNVSSRPRTSLRPTSRPMVPVALLATLLAAFLICFSLIYFFIVS